MDTTVKQKVNTGVPARLILATVLVAALFTGAFAKSRYYHENFEGFPLGNNITTNGAHTNNGWIWNFRMSRDIMASDVWADLAGSFGNDYPAGVMITNNLGSDKKLYLYGKPNNRDILWNNWYVGDGVKFDPKLNSNLQSNAISATSEDPFGYTIIRYETSIDPQGGAQSGEYVKGFIGTWLAEDNGAASANDRYDNFVYFYDKSRYDAFNVFGVFNNVEYDKDWNNLLRDTDGVSVGTVLNVSNNFRKQMDLDSDAGDPAENNSKWYNTRLTYDNPVTYPLGIRMTTDGSSVRIFVNYNPTNDPGIGLNNAWVLVDERPANIKNDILALLIAETPYFRPESIETQFDNFLVRTVASNVSASITPRKAVSNAQVRFTVDVRPEGVTANDSGIGEIYIKKPAGYGAFNLNNLIVSNAGQQLQVISNGAPTAAQVYATNLGAEIYLRFCMTSKAVNGILTNTNATVSFLIQTPTTMTVGGDEFEVYADCVKHFNSANDILFDPANGLKYATTGRKKARPAGAGNLVVTTYSQPKGGVLLEYSPAPIIVGNDAAAFTVKLFTVSPTSPDITSFRILIPTNIAGPNFMVSNNAPGQLNIRSLALTESKSTNNISITTVGGSNFIIVYYTNLPGGGLPGNNGLDLISFNVYGTPNVPGGLSFTNYRWLAQVNSSDGSNGVAGTTWQTATNSTNTGVDNFNITNQDSRVGMSNAMLSAYIQPSRVAITPQYVSNAVKYIYTFRNNGPAGNTAYQMRVQIPDGFAPGSISNALGQTNAFTLSNFTGTAVYSNSAIWVQFNAPGFVSGQVGTLTFFASHTNTNINLPATNYAFTLWADNSNSAGYNIMTEDAPNTWSVSVNPPKPDAEYTASVIRETVDAGVTNTFTNLAVYTSDVSNRLELTVNNLSPNGVSLKLVKIEYPTNLFTNLSVQSAHLASQGNIQLSNGTGGTNWIFLKYYADANGEICSAYDTATNAFYKKDTVTLWLGDTITNGTFASMPTNVFLTVKAYKSDLDGATNDADEDMVKEIGATEDNRINIEYPPLAMEYALMPYELDTTAVVTNVTNMIVNRGAPGNRILTNYIYFPRSVTTNIYNIDCSSPKVLQKDFDTVNNRIRIFYDPAQNGLDGGETNYVSFVMEDIVEGQTLQALITNSGANDRHLVFHVTNVAAGGYGTLYFNLPMPKGGGFASQNVFYATANELPGTVLTQEMVLTVTNEGVGSDRFDAVQVDIPLPFIGMVNVLSNARNSLITANASNFIVNYTNGTPNPLGSGQSDRIFVRVRVTNVNTLPTNGLWKFYANNGWEDGSVVPARKFFDITNSFSAGMRLAQGTERPTAFQGGTSLTTDQSNTNIVIVLTNGLSAGSQPVRGVLVAVPSPLYSVYNVQSSGAAVAQFVSNGTNYMSLDYSGSIMPGDSKDIRISASRPPLIDPTNVNWMTWVKYDSNIVPQYVDMLKGDLTEQILLPDAFIYGWANTNSIGKDEQYGDFVINLSNYGVPANRLYRVVIAPPSSNTNDYTTVITNITDMASQIPGAVLTYSNGMIFVNYEAGGTNLAGGQMDRISLRAYDNQDNPGFTGKWQVWADNSRTAARLLPGTDPELAGVGRLDLTFFQPPYNAGYAVLSNAVVSTVDSQTNIVIGVANRSLGAIDIAAVRVLLPYPVTNITGFTSRLGATLVTNTVVNGTNLLEVSYGAGVFTTVTNDALTLTLQDGFDIGDTNSFVQLLARYTTSGSSYIPAIVEGGTNELSFRMPPPSVGIVMTSNIYTSQTNGTVVLQIRMTNRGKGSNNARKISFTVPAAFTNGLSASSLITNGLATNVTFIAPNGFEVDYDGFEPGLEQQLVLQLQNTNNQESEYSVMFNANNGFLGTNVSTALGLRKPPSAQFVSRFVDVTAVSNQMVLTVENTSAGSRLQTLRVALPAYFSQIDSPVSTLGVTLSNTGTELFVDYGTGIAYGSGDTVSFWVTDTTNMFETNNLAWTVEANNGTGYGQVRELSSGGLKTAFFIPDPAATNIVATGWYQINTGGALTNLFRFTVVNNGTGQNYVVSNRVILPPELTNLAQAPTASFPGAVVTVESNELVVTYAAPYLLPGLSNTVSFAFLNGVLSRRNVYADFTAYNPGVTNTPAESRQKIEFLAPGEQTEAFVNNKQKIYSIDNTATIVYNINNGMYDLGIETVTIGFSNSLLTVTNVRSYIYGTSVPFTVSESNLVLNYAPLGYLPGKLGLSNGQETVYIDVIYTNNANWTIDMRAVVVFQASLDESAAAVPSGETASLPVLVADFGRITGIALPGNANPAVKLYAPGIYTNIVTNTNGLLSVTANQQSGVYTLDFVPPGTYDVGFSGANYKESYLTNIVVTVNRVTNIGTYKMTRDYLRPGAGTEQLAVSLDDTNTFVAVPVGVVGESFTLDIWLTNFNAAAPDMELKANGGTIETPAVPSAVKVWWFDMRGSSGDTVTEQEIKSNIVVTLHYEDAEITAQGWSESRLSVYYWKSLTREWVRIGGTVDPVANTISFTGSYIHKYYVVLGDSAQARPETPAFVSVSVEPRIFTPRSGGNDTGNVKIAFALDQGVTETTYELKIYDVTGRAVKTFKRDAPYKQGEVFWDGKDDEGFPVRSGVYVYRVIVGSQVYSGTIVIAR